MRGWLSFASYRQTTERQATDRLQRLVPDSAKDWCTPKVRVRHGKAYVEILREAEDDRADLLVLGVHGGPSLDHLMLGSTTNQVVRRARCPVLTVRG